ncbi:globin domain-containing protein [Zhongshania sp.]|uniref:globin domain-containing protein n=1 Tax=Zhongshania sp. TaxID=1971902 RepID=UPI003569AA66
MTPQQITCIQKNFRTISAVSRPFSRLYYLRLFQLSPELKRHINSHADYKGRKLFALLGAAVRSLDNIDGLQVVVSSLGRRYTAQGIDNQHFALMSQALLETLEMALGDEFTGDVAVAWTAGSALLLETLSESTAKTTVEHCPWGKEIPIALAVVN